MNDQGKQLFKGIWRTQRGSLRRTLVLGLFYLIAMLVLYGHLVAFPARFAEGQLLPFNLRAPEETSYLDEEYLDELTGISSEGELLTYIDQDQAETSLSELDQFSIRFNELRQRWLDVERNGEEPPAAPANGQNQIGSLRSDTSTLAEDCGLNPTVLTQLFHTDQQVLDSAFVAARSKLASQMRKPVTEELLNTLRDSGEMQIISQPEQLYVLFLRPNLLSLESEDRRNELAHLAWKQIERGELIVGEGMRVDQRALAKLSRLENSFSQRRVLRFIALALILGLALFLWYMYVQRFSASKLGLVSTLIQLSLIYLIFLIIGLGIGRLGFDYAFYGVSFAVAALAGVVVLIYEERFAVYLALALAVVLAVTLNFGASLTIYTMAAALLPSVVLSPGCPRLQQVMFTLVQAAFNMLLVGVIILSTDHQFSYVPFLVASVSGFAAAVVALGLLPVMETFSGQLTPGRLFELANPENEMLKRLKQEAHGTYSHSEMVADLTEEGCKAIGANWLQARVGALYHDIGKIKRPGFFAENIHDLSKNPHHGIPPATSVKILKDHVTDGLVMAKEIRLPKELHRYIGEHHGTYVIKYFFYQAQKLHQQDPENNPEPKQKEYSYDGPTPASRESGVVMLADITEAVTRARRTSDAGEIAAIIEKIADEKLREGQLDNSGLSVGDLASIKQAFRNLLISRSHQRIQYPEGQEPAPVQFHFIDRTDENGTR